MGKEKWSDLVVVVERLEQSHRSRDSKGKGILCAIIMCVLLGTYLIQAQDHFDYSGRLEENNLKKQLEIDCLRGELQREREQMHLFVRTKKIEITLAEAKKPLSIVQI